MIIKKSRIRSTQKKKKPLLDLVKVLEAKVFIKKREKVWGIRWPTTFVLGMMLFT